MVVQSRTNIQEIAQRANVPVEQAANVILGKPGVPDAIRQRVLGVLADAGLIEMSAQRKPSDPVIGIVIPGPVIDDYVGEVIRGISDTAGQHGYSLAINVQNPDVADDLVGLFQEGVCDGLIAIVPFNYDELLTLCQEHNRPYVLVDYQGDDDISHALSVEVHNRQSIVNVMHYLFELGHTRIGFITGMLEHSSARQRLQGYVDALAEAGIEYDSALVRVGDWLHATAYPLTQQLLQLNDPPTAIVASNDLSAFGAMQAANEMGLIIGRDLSVTGFDDIKMAGSVAPPLTTVRQPMYAMGQLAGDMLIMRLRGEPVAPPHVQLDTQLVVRESTGAAPIPSWT
jgi:LacI family transcriptional regulator